MLKPRIIFLGLVLAMPIVGLYGQNQTIPRPNAQAEPKEPLAIKPNVEKQEVLQTKSQATLAPVIEEISAYDWARMKEEKRLEILAEPGRFRLAKDAQRRINRSALTKLTQDETQHLRENPSLYLIVD